MTIVGGSRAKPSTTCSEQGPPFREANNAAKAKAAATKQAKDRRLAEKMHRAQLRRDCVDQSQYVAEGVEESLKTKRMKVKLWTWAL